MRTVGYALICALIAFSAVGRASAQTLFQPGFELLATSETIYRRPHDVALSPDGAYLLAADLGNDDIKVLDPMTLRLLSSFGAGVLSGPHDVTFLAPDKVLVADTSNDRIAVFEFAGIDGAGGAKAKLIASWGHSISNPEGVAVSPDGRWVYATNVGGGSVVKMDATGKVMKKVGGYGAAGALSFDKPHDIAVHADGRVFVADSGNDRMVILTRDLEFITELKGPPYDFDDPKYMAFDADGDLWLADEYRSRVLRLGNDNAIKQIIGTGKKGSGPGELNWPEGVEVRGDLIWISDTYNNRILLLKRVK